MIRRFLLWILRDDLVRERRLLEIEEEWRDLLTKLAAAAAREAKAAKRALRKAVEHETHHPATPPQAKDRKAALRERAAAARGLRVVGGGTLPEVGNESGDQDQSS